MSRSPTVLVRFPQTEQVKKMKMNSGISGFFLACDRRMDPYSCSVIFFNGAANGFHRPEESAY